MRSDYIRANIKNITANNALKSKNHLKFQNQTKHSYIPGNK